MIDRLNSLTEVTTCLTLAVVVLIGLVGCAADTSSPGSREVTVAPVMDPNATAGIGMTRDELAEQVRRFADRFGARLNLATDHLMEQAMTPRQRSDAQRFQMSSLISVTDIAIGPDAVTNLLDAIVLATLTRLMVENFFVPEVLGEEMGQELLSATLSLEEDIWRVSENVLTPAQRTDLRTLILEWHSENSEQYYIWGIRFSQFSGQRAAALRQVTRTGGLLTQVQKTRETIDEVRALGERVLYYLQRAPLSVRMQAQLGVYEVVGQSEVTSLIEDANRITTSVERFATVAEELPEKRFQAIEQLGDRLGEERAAFMEDLFAEEETVRAVLKDLQQTVAVVNELVVNVDGLAAKLNLGDPNKEPLDVNGLHQVVVGASEAAGEFATLVEKVEELMASPAWDKRIPQATQAVDEVGDDVDVLLKKVFVFAIAMVAVFFAFMLIYLYALTRFARRRVPA